MREARRPDGEPVADRRRSPATSFPTSRSFASTCARERRRSRPIAEAGDRRGDRRDRAPSATSRSSCSGGFGRPPKPLTPEAEALFNLVKKAGADLGQPIAWQPSGGVCDGNNIAACGVPVVDTMGVRGGKIHSGEEFLIVESLAERAALSALTILRLGEAA